ncbi:XRE family transcriptional regulator [Chromobacterium sp. Rain0013]|nr:XRE family transcriptional regulator [Chromobacterium sp. Rain0013]
MRRVRIKAPTTTFGRHLREARLKRGIPQDKLGVQIGLDESTASARISRYETGTHAPPLKTVVRLAAALEIPVLYFFCEDDGLAKVSLAWMQISPSEKEHLLASIQLEDKQTKLLSRE